METIGDDAGQNIRRPLAERRRFGDGLGRFRGLFGIRMSEKKVVGKPGVETSRCGLETAIEFIEIKMNRT